MSREIWMHMYSVMWMQCKDQYQHVSKYHNGQREIQSNKQTKIKDKMQ